MKHTDVSRYYKKHTSKKIKNKNKTKGSGLFNKDTRNIYVPGNII